MVEQGLAETRSQARALIMSGLVLKDSERVEKAGQMLPVDAELSLKDKDKIFVSRGGLKLQGALDDLGLDVAGLRILDIGASTGGFTDCALKSGASHVTAVDVGYGQLHWRLRQDRRVRVMERVNARYLKPEDFGEPFEPFDLALLDVSFISLELILPRVAALIKPSGRILALVKPQFEAGRDKVGAGGVVRDGEVQAAVVLRISAAGERIGLKTLGQAPSRLLGPKGNQEFFLLLQLPG